MNDDDLKNLLKTWNPKVPESADFRRNVWRRIEHSRSSSRLAFFEWLTRPKIAAALLAVSILAGVFTGAEISAASQGDAYLRSVNPYAQTP